MKKTIVFSRFIMVIIPFFTTFLFVLPFACSQDSSYVLPCYVAAGCGSVPVSTEASPCEQYPFGSNYFIIPANANASSLSKTTFQSEAVYISGDFIVDANVSFLNCKVKVSPNATIKTSGDKNITIINSQFFSCNGLWAGIELSQYGTLKMVNSLISDARIAIRLMYGYSTSGTYIIRNKFIRNQNGIYVRNLSGDYTNTTLTSFYGNKFDGTAFYTDPAKTQLIVPNRAIYLFRTNATITGTSNPKNEILNYSVGMEAVNANVSLSNIKFHDMYYDNKSSKEEQGIGLLAKNSVLKTLGSLGSNGCEFYDCCSKGVWARNCDIDLQGGQYSGFYKYGIDSDLNNQKQIKIKQNKFVAIGSSHNAAIRVGRGMHLSPSIVNTISENTFDLEGATFGVLVQDKADGSALDVFEVSDNLDFKINKGFYGIYIDGYTGNTVNESLNFQIVNNHVTCSGNESAGFAISLNDCDGNMKDYTNVINANIVSSPEADVDNELCNIHLTSSKYSTVCLNEVSGGFRGFHFFGNCDYTHFAENTIKSNQIGLHVSKLNCLLEPGILGVQVRTLNYWELENYAHGKYPFKKSG